MYRAKALGKRRYEVFAANMRDSIIRRLAVENDLRCALERHEFRNVYQPIVSLSSGKIAGFEALLRWQHPVRGVVEPSEFIPVAEETGLIRDAGWWALNEACRQVAIWQKMHPSLSDLCVNVNLSLKQLADPQFGHRLEALLREHDLAPGSLALELTESCIMSDSTAAIATLTSLRSLGVQLAIDDFGTGYSSLSYLHQFPLDTLKIDRSFTDAMRRGAKDANTIAQTIMRLAQDLGLVVIAEGVETVEQANLLRGLHCQYAQGFLFSRPIDAGHARQMLIDNIDGRQPAPVIGRPRPGDPA